jgi:D-alanyl-D-alanine-carboxypeptidase/D-alanyl-D-alanine-endopeptidase
LTVYECTILTWADLVLKRREFLTGTLASALVAALGSNIRAYGKSLDQATIAALLHETVKAGSDKTGVVAAVVDEDGASQVVTHGHSGMPDNRPLDADTVFEVGSITKVLTALLLVDMSARGEVAMTDPVAKYLPDSVRIPQLDAPITLLDLATYTSGLPNMPVNLQVDWRNPFAGYTVEKMYAGLADFQLKHAPGTHYQYANLGFGLLGVALARRAGKSFEQLMVERICRPLKLGSTRITLTDSMRRHIVQPHDRELKPVPMWDIPALAGAGAARSNAKDMTSFLKTCLGLRRSSRALSFEKLLQTRRPTGVPGTDVGLGWFISSDSSDEIVWKSGLTGGCATNIAFSTRSCRGSIVLMNAPLDAIHVGVKLVNPDFDVRGLYAVF